MNKIIIFDFDDTLYSGGIKKADNYDYNMLRSMFSELNDRAFDRLCKKYKIKDKNQITDDLCVEIAVKEGKDPFETISSYFEKNDEKFERTPTTKTISNEVLKTLKKLGYDIFVVSNSPQTAVVRNAMALGLDLSLTTIYGMPYRVPYDNFKHGNKVHRYKTILEKTGIAPENITVIGNSFEADIIPAMQLKMHGVVCENAELLTVENIEMCVNDRNIINITQVTNEDYKTQQQESNLQNKYNIPQTKNVMPKTNTSEFTVRVDSSVMERGERN